MPDTRTDRDQSLEDKVASGQAVVERSGDAHL